MPEVVEVSFEVKRKLKILSAQLGRPMKELANEAISEYLKKFERRERNE
jgi:predicted DNA-binding protein